MLRGSGINWDLRRTNHMMHMVNSISGFPSALMGIVTTDT